MSTSNPSTNVASENTKLSTGEGVLDSSSGSSGGNVNDSARLDLQHTLMKIHLGGLYLAPTAVRRALERRSDALTPAILDLGTGSGAWAVEMAQEFPDATITGIDIAPVAVSNVPSNVHFERGDINDVMRTFHQSFNVIHARCVCSGIRDYTAFLLEAQKALRPDGVLLLVEGDPQFYGPNHEPMTGADENDPKFSWLQRVMGIVWARIIGSKSSIPSSLPQLLGGCHGWDNRGSSSGFIAIGPWPKDMTEPEKEVSELMRQNWMQLILAVRPLVLADGHSPETADLWIANAVDELKSLKKNQYVKWTSAWASLPAQSS